MEASLLVSLFGCIIFVSEGIHGLSYRVLLAMDVSVSSSLGRPCAIQEEE